MSLQSQMARPISRRSNMYRRRQRGRRRMSRGVVVIGVIAIGAWAAWRWYGPGFAPPPGNAEPAIAKAMIPPADTDRQTERNTDHSATKREPVRQSSQPPLGYVPPKIEKTQKNEAPAVTGSSPPVAAPAPADQHTESSQSAPGSKATKTAAPSGASRSDTRSRQQDAGSMARRRVVRQMQIGRDLIRTNDPVEARRILTEVLRSNEITPAEASAVRAELTEVSERLIFSPEVVEDDPYAFTYVVQSGDSLEKIRKRLSLQIDWRFIQRINRIARPERIREGQRLKLITGPFHAEVNKRTYTLDLYLGDPPSRVYVRSFTVGLGEFNSTPTGLFQVRENSKLINPEWVNPRTGKKFEPDDPANPIGERWIGLIGIDEAVRDVQGYGIHGTVDLDSIGKQASMGCVRLRPDDVALIYDVMTGGVSTIQINSGR